MFDLLSYVTDGEDRASGLTHDVLRRRSDERPLDDTLGVPADHDEPGLFLGSYAKNRAIGFPGLDAFLHVAIHAGCIGHDGAEPSERVRTPLLDVSLSFGVLVRPAGQFTWNLGDVKHGEVRIRLLGKRQRITERVHRRL